MFRAGVTAVVGVATTGVAGTATARCIALLFAGVCVTVLPWVADGRTQGPAASTDAGPATAAMPAASAARTTPPAPPTPTTSATSATPVAPASRPEPGVFGRAPAIDALTLSPSGARLAFLATGSGEPAVGVMQVDGRQVLDRLALGERRLVGLDWADDDRLLVTTYENEWLADNSAGLRAYTRLQIYDVRTRRLLPFRTDRPAGPRDAVGQRPVVRRTAEGVRVYVRSAVGGLYLVSLDTGVGREVENTDDGGQYFLDADGRVAAVAGLDPVARAWRVLIRRPGAADLVRRGDSAVDLLVVHGFDATGSALIVSEEGADTRQFRTLSLADGDLGAPLALPDEPVSFLGERLTDRTYARHFPLSLRYEFADAAHQQRWDATVRAFGTRPLRLVSSSDDFSSAVVRVEDPARGPEFYLVNFASGQGARVGAMYDGLPPLAPVRAYEYAAADGLPISAALTLPRGREWTGLPLVVLVDSRPAVAQAYDAWSQALAAEGYAVLRPNRRGTDVSSRLRRAGHGELGGRMQSDLADGVRRLVQEGLVDPARVCIAGRGYGAYAAAAGVTLESGTYRCAIALGGPYDLPAHLDHVTSRAGWGAGFEVRQVERLLGVSGRNDPRAAQLSPARNAAKASAPVLLLHAAQDTWSPPSQAREFAHALRRAGRPVELVTLEAEDQRLQRPDSMTTVVRESVRFLRTHNPAD